MRNHNLGYTYLAIICPGILFLLGTIRAMNIYSVFRDHITNGRFPRYPLDDLIWWSAFSGFWVLISACLVWGIFKKSQKVEQFVSSRFFQQWYAILWCLLWALLVAFTIGVAPMLLGPVVLTFLILDLFGWIPSEGIWLYLISALISLPITIPCLYLIFSSKRSQEFYEPLISAVFTFLWVLSSVVLIFFVD